MSMPSMQILSRYHYDPLDRLVIAGPSQRFYQAGYLATELDDQGLRSIMRHAAQPLAQQRGPGGAGATTLLATDLAQSPLLTLTGALMQRLSYTGYGYAPAESGLSRLLGFNGECPDRITGHYLLGNGKRAFNPVLMRFNSPDELSPFEEGGLNAYAYCAGDPINYQDPTGNARFKIPNPGVTPKRQSATMPNPMYKVKETASTIASRSPAQQIQTPPGPSTQQPGPSNSSVIVAHNNVPHPLPAATEKWKTKHYVGGNSKAFKSRLKDDVNKYDNHIKIGTLDFTTTPNDYQKTRWHDLSAKIQKLPRGKSDRNYKAAIRQQEDLASRIKQTSVINYETRNNIRR